jgi:hypothetical protein
MNGFWRLAHFLGLIMWLGGSLAVMVGGVVRHRLDRSLWVGVMEANGNIYRVLVGPGAVLTLLTGAMMTLRLYNALGGGVGLWMGLMQSAGILGGLGVLVLVLPTASRIQRIDPAGADAAAFDALRVRLALYATISGTLGLVALVGGAFYRG